MDVCTILILILTVIVLLISLWIRWRRNRLTLFEKCGIPGPKPDFFFGNLREFNKKKEEGINEWIVKYGNVFGFFLGAKPYVVCSDTELLKLIHIKQFKNFMNKDAILPDGGMSHKLIFKSLPLLKGEEWKNTRAILNTSFSSSKIKQMSTLMFDPIKTFLKKVEKSAQEPFDISELYKKLTFDINCRASFGIETNVQNEETSKFVKSVYGILAADSTDPLVNISLLFGELEPIPTFLRHVIDAIRNIRDQPCVHAVVNTCQQIIASRKKSQSHPPDLLQTMIDAEFESSGKMKKLTNDVIIGNALIFMATGYDTTCSTLEWVTYFLTRYPEMQEKVRQEVNDNVQRSNEINYSDLANFQYMDQVISEALRVSPFTSFTVSRICLKDFKYKDITIPEGAAILTPLLYLHTKEDYWQEPQTFNPDRFSPENKGKIDPHNYQPFGSGPRMCIGMKMAQHVMKFALANLIRNFRLELMENFEVEKKYTMFLTRPNNGVFVRAIPI